MTRMSRFTRFGVATVLILAAVYVTLGAAPTKAQQYPETSFQEMRWRNIGPYRGGRTRALAGVPSQPNVFYIGSVAAGSGRAMTLAIRGHRFSTIRIPARSVRLPWLRLIRTLSTLAAAKACRVPISLSATECTSH